MKFNNPFLKKVKLLDPHSGKFIERISHGGKVDLENGLYKNSDGTLTAYDMNMVCIEIYNRLDEENFFEKMSPHLPGPQKLICKGKDWLIMPHQYYIGSTKSGQPLELIKNYGNSKRIGNKKVSRPE